MKNIAVLIFCVLCSMSLSAQESNESDKTNTIFVGYPAGVFDSPKLGVHLAYSKEWVKRKRFSWEGQGAISFSNYERNSNNFAHDGGDKTTAALLVGPRVYLNKPTRKTRAFINLLLGPALLIDREYKMDGFSPEAYLNEIVGARLGYSAGAFLQFNNKFLLGFSFETSETISFKLGYKF